MHFTFSLAPGSGKKATFVFNEFQLDDVGATKAGLANFMPPA